MKRVGESILPISFVAFMLVLLGWGSQAQAQIITLFDQNSVSQINTGSQSGMFNWSVDGQNQISQQAFWFRIGSIPEQSVDTISAPTISTPDARTLNLSYNNGVNQVQVGYALTGGVGGSHQSSITETIILHNASTAGPLDYHFFEYNDFDLGGSAAGDTIQLSNAGPTYLAQQSDAAANIKVSESTTAPPGSTVHFEAGFFPVTLIGLNDGNPTTLNDNAGPAGPGDVTWAYQWDAIIAAGGSLTITKQLDIAPLGVPVPLPPALWGGMALLGVLGGKSFLKRQPPTKL